MVRAASICIILHAILKLTTSSVPNVPPTSTDKKPKKRQVISRKHKTIPAKALSTDELWLHYYMAYNTAKTAKTKEWRSFCEDDSTIPSEYICRLSVPENKIPRVEQIIGHAAQLIFPCLGFLHRNIMRKDMNSTAQCRIVYELPSLHSWARSLITATKCNYSVGSLLNVSEGTDHRCSAIMEVTKIATGASTSLNSFDVNADISSWLYGNLNIRPERASPSTVSLGILNRKSNRRFQGVEYVFNRRSRYFSVKSVRISITTMDDKSMSEQAAWMRSKDIILTPHGSQVSNALFLRKCAALVEFFPANYFLPNFYGPLVSEVGSLAFAVSNGTGQTPSTFEERERVRSRNVVADDNFAHYVACVVLPEVVRSRMKCLRSLSRKESAGVDQGMSFLSDLQNKCSSSRPSSGAHHL